MLGAQVNVTGTVNVFEAVKRLGLETPIAYASSAAVYDRAGDVAPSTLYGVFKLANEGTAAVFAADHGIASVGLRPFTVYGPGRDQGMTAGRPGDRGRRARRALPDRLRRHAPSFTTRATSRAPSSRPPARRRPTHRFCIGGPAMSIADFVALVVEAVPGADVSFDETVLPFPDQLPEPWFDSPLTPLEEGVRETAAILRSLV